ncbi:9057_t:CDS:2, partial [Paraglomus brasilianum]
AARSKTIRDRNNPFRPNSYMMESSLTEKLETIIVKFKEELEITIKDFGKLEENKPATFITLKDDIARKITSIESLEKRLSQFSDLQTTLQREKYISHEISQSVLRMSEALKRERALREMIMLGVVWLAIAMMAFIGLVVIVPSSVQDGIN